MLKIMIVYDDYVISEELKAIVLDLDYEVVDVVGSGEAAIAMVSLLKPDVILMDIVMPGGMDGTNAAKIIMESIDCAVVFVTGYGSNKIIQRAVNVEPHGYLLKPFEPAEIKTCIEFAFHKKQIECRLKKAYSDVLSGLKERISELETSNHHLNTLLNAPTNSMALLDIDGTVIAGNPIVAKGFRMDFEEFIGKCVYDIMPKELANYWKFRLDRVIETGKPSQFTDKREKVSFDNHVYPIFDNTGKVIQLAVYGKDLSCQPCTF